MPIIYCGKTSKNSYYIHEADIHVYSIQEIAYFIYNYAMLISKHFISKNLIYYIGKELGMTSLFDELNILYNKNEDISVMLITILKHSNYYDDEEIKRFNQKLWTLLGMKEVDYINESGDSLYRLGKYDKAIAQYDKNKEVSDYALKMLGYSYAKMLMFDKAIWYLTVLFQKTKDKAVLKDLYFCYKLSGNEQEFSFNFKDYIDDQANANWEIEIIKIMLKAKNSDNVKNIEEMFLMGNNYIMDNMKEQIDLWKEKYRCIG